MPQLQGLIEKEFNRIESFFREHLTQKNKNLQEIIFGLIQQICRAHEAESLNVGLRLKASDDCRNWIVKDLYNTVLFSFSIGESIAKWENAEEVAFPNTKNAVMLLAIAGTFVFITNIISDFEMKIMEYIIHNGHIIHH